MRIAVGVVVPIARSEWTSCRSRHRSQLEERLKSPPGSPSHILLKPDKARGADEGRSAEDDLTSVSSYDSFEDAQDAGDW